MLKNDDLFYPNRGKKSSVVQQALPTMWQLKNVADNCFGEADDGCGEVDDDLLAPFMTATRPASFTDQMRATILKKLQSKSREEQIHRQLQNYWQQLRHQVRAATAGSNGLPQQMSLYKMNGYDQSVKSSMPSAMAATKITTIPAATRAIKNTLWQQLLHRSQHLLPQQQQREPVFHIDVENVASGDEAANRLQHLPIAQQTKSMSTGRQQSQQQQQQQHARPSSIAMSADLQHELSLRDNQQRSLTNFEALAGAKGDTAPLFWRQLQLLQQNALTMRHPQLSRMQHLPAALQPPLLWHYDLQHEKPQETQLASVGRPDLRADHADISSSTSDPEQINYLYLMNA